MFCDLVFDCFRENRVFNARPDVRNHAVLRVFRAFHQHFQNRNFCKILCFYVFSAWFLEFVVLRMRSDVQNSLILLVFRIVHQKFGNHNFLKIQCFVFSFWLFSGESLFYKVSPMCAAIWFCEWFMWFARIRKITIIVNSCLLFGSFCISRSPPYHRIPCLRLWLCACLSRRPRWPPSLGSMPPVLFPPRVRGCACARNAGLGHHENIGNNYRWHCISGQFGRVV